MKNLVKDFNKLEGAWAAAGFSVVLIMVGLPIWWWTTTVYRAALPYSSINSLSSYHPYHSVNLSIIGHNSKYLKEVLHEKLTDQDTNIKFYISSESLSQKEKEIFHTAESFYNIESKFDKKKFHSGSLTLFLLPENSSVSSTSSIYISKRRLIFISGNVDVDRLSDVIRAMVLNPLANLHLTRHVTKSEDYQDRDGMQVMRQVPTEPGYDVTLTLMLPQPHLLRAEWDVSQAVEDYLDPLVNQLKNISELRIRSQILYMTSMKISPKWSTKYKHYSLPEQQLPITINAIEAKLGSFVSTRPALHFIIYVPSDLQTPLQIHTKEGIPLSANSFLVPRWGGIMIHNPPPDLLKKRENQSLPLTFQIDSRWVMSTVAFHLHKLFPIPSLKEMDVKFTEAIYTNELTDWQLDGIARARVLSYLNNIRITLQSLCDLVGEISNMVVSDEVAGWVWSAVDDWKECLDASRDGRLEKAMKYCKDAFVYSDAAFFHPSMLALLYFPDNQKYAIYVPLFLPVSIPVVLSLRTISKLFRFKDKKD